MMNILNQFHL